MTLYEQLRDAPANCMIPMQGGVGTPTVALTEPARAAVLNLIEAAQEIDEPLELVDRSSDMSGWACAMCGEWAARDGDFPHQSDCPWPRFAEAVAVFVSGQEEPKGKP